MRNLCSTFAWVAAIAMSSGCGFVHDEPLVGPYREIAIDIDADMAICEETTIGDAVQCVVPPTVFARGHDRDFIIAKQHPPTTRDGLVVDKSKTNYWIIRVADRSVVGPLGEEAFQAERVRLRVPETLAFDVVHEDLM